MTRLALGGAGTGAAIGMIVTIAGGSLFGAAGLILAAPVTSAVVRISADLSRARARGSPVAAEDGSAPKADAVPA